MVAPDAAFPFDNGKFDVVFATQGVEHVENLPHTLGEIARVCKAGGVIVLSFPFSYNEHGTPYNFQRFLPTAQRVYCPLKLRCWSARVAMGARQ